MVRISIGASMSAVGTFAMCHSANCAAFDVVVGFGGPPAIPVSRWAVAATIAGIALVAHRAFRRRRGPTVLGWFGAAIVSASLAAFGAGVLGSGMAKAADPAVLQLDSSPGRFTVPPGAVASMSMSGGGYRITVSNQTGRTVWITDRGIEENNPDNPLLFYLPGNPEGAECTSGLSLAPGAVCLLYVRLSSSFS